MREMLPQFLIPMPSRRNVHIPQDLIPLETPVDPTRISRHTLPQLRALGELPSRVIPDMRNDVLRMHILLLRHQPLRILGIERLVLKHSRGDLPVELLVPHLPVGRVFGKQHPRHDVVARRVLDVNA